MRPAPFIVAACIMLAACPAAADTRSPAPTVQVSVGYAGFLDDITIDHLLVGGSARWHVTPRLSVGPEVTYAIGPRDQRTLFVTGNLTVDLGSTSGRSASRVTPYLLVGAGLFRHSDRFGAEKFASHEVGLTGGGGLRMQVTPQLTIAPEVRIGWEPHCRVEVTMGYRFQ